MFVKTSLRHRLVCFEDSVGITLLAFVCLLTFPQSLSSLILRSCLEFFSTTNNICIFWHSKFQQVSTHAFCSRDDILTQEWNCTSPANLSKCIETATTLSTNTSIEWNLLKQASCIVF